MQKMINKLRADFERVAEHRTKTGDWTQEDQQEIGLAIKAAIDAQDADTLASWACWLADLSHSITAWELIVQGTMARMRTEARRQREAADASKGGRK